MALLSITRLRLQSWRGAPGFCVWVMGSLWQSLRADGLLGLQLLRDRHNVFWTLTIWRDSKAMQAFRSQGAHGQAMKHLVRWCDESAAAHWDLPDVGQQPLSLPAWSELHQRLMQQGHFATLPLASADQRERQIPAPALGRGRLIKLR